MNSVSIWCPHVSVESRFSDPNRHENRWRGSGQTDRRNCGQMDHDGHTRRGGEHLWIRASMASMDSMRFEWKRIGELSSL